MGCQSSAIGSGNAPTFAKDFRGRLFATTPAVALALAAFACGDSQSATTPTSAPSVVRPLPQPSTTAPLKNEYQDAASYKVSNTPDSNALNEILAAMPRQRPTATGENGRSLVGSETGSDIEKKRKRKRRLRLQSIHFSRTASLPAVNRMLFAQIAWTLHERCSMQGSTAVPAGSIRLEFAVMNDGRVDPLTVQAVPINPKWQPAASCVGSELRSLAPSEISVGLDRYTRVTVRWPIVD